jgi:hypothetical protein
VPVSQGLKAGLAAGVVYGLLVGLLHLGTLEACSSSQLGYISQQLIAHPVANVTASDLFTTDIIYYPMVYGIWTLIYGVVFGAVFAALYLRLPGLNSKRKGLFLAVPVFFIGVFAGPASFFYQCDPSYVPYISFLFGIPAAFTFGYFLGIFYDSFGRLALEQKEKRSKEPADAEKPR